MKAGLGTSPSIHGHPDWQNLSDKPGQKDGGCGLGFDGLFWWELSYSSSPTTATDPEFFLHES